MPHYEYRTGEVITAHTHARSDSIAEAHAPESDINRSKGEAGPDREVSLPIGRNHSVVGVFSWRLSQIPHLAAFLGAERVVWLAPGLRAGWRAGRLDAIAGWGHRPTADRARAFAAGHGLPYLALEDGFLRSLTLASRAAPPLSLAVDDLGIYYDASGPSRLEAVLNDDAAFREADLTRADAALAAIHRHGLSKYNHG
ncbi:MAG: hypothetical protein IMF08_03490, partial [Proteobacteria bacterium]|nr:hypothetical protein [Pseudomonadota bacterium]